MFPGASFAGIYEPQSDELALLDDDDSMDPQDPEDEIQGMNGDPGRL